MLIILVCSTSYSVEIKEIESEVSKFVAENLYFYFLYNMCGFTQSQGCWVFSAVEIELLVIIVSILLLVRTVVYCGVPYRNMGCFCNVYCHFMSDVPGVHLCGLVQLFEQVSV